MQYSSIIFFILFLSCQNSTNKPTIAYKEHRIKQTKEGHIIHWKIDLKTTIKPISIGATMTHPNTDGPTWEIGKDRIKKIEENLYRIKGTYKLSKFSPKGYYYLIIHDLSNQQNEKILIDEHIEIIH
ncbi:hypothetical protein N9N67_04615 [Bacteriovoracaceae bacterium]|nr:hypothetical protein [Bacteriovoracaceae bacterium]